MKRQSMKAHILVYGGDRFWITRRGVYRMHGKPEYVETDVPACAPRIKLKAADPGNRRTE